MSEQTTQVEAKVGPYDGDGTFLGEVIRFTGEEVGFYRENITGDTRGGGRRVRPRCVERQ